MAKEEAKKTKKPGFGKNALLAGAAVVVILIVVGALAVLGYFTSSPVPSNGGTAPIDSPMAKLVLSTYDRGAAVGDYSVVYSINENGIVSKYSVIKRGDRLWVGIDDIFGTRQGFFGTNSSQDVVCLTYDNATKCAMVLNNTNMGKISNSIKAWMLDDGTTNAQIKALMEKHIVAGAIRFDEGVVEEKAGVFDAQKVSYSLDYRNLTVEKLLSLGIPADDPGITSKTDQRVTFWVDKNTGLLVKGLATYVENKVAGENSKEFSKIDLAPKDDVPSAPADLASIPVFVTFYKQSDDDFLSKQECRAQATAADRDACWKAVAVSHNSWDLCKNIEDKKTYEGCTIIVAQGTNNKVLCEKLELFSDDCYIAVASETGDYQLCKLLKNSSLVGDCTSAAGEGEKKVSAREAAARKVFEARNCVVDSDCARFGNSNQYCAPKTPIGVFPNETSPLFACLNGVSCSCTDGFCGFNRTDDYYDCYNGVEDGLVRAYIESLAANMSSRAGDSK